ncbi:MAG: hypothetical protein ABW252_17345 [Polyangiales bacterium]
MWRIGALFLLSWLGDPPEAGGPPVLSVDAAPTLRCPGGERTLAALARQLAPRTVVPTAATLGRFHLTLRAHGTHGVVMTLRTGSTLLVDRTLEVAPHECEGLADTVALITAAWVRDADRRVDAAVAAPTVAPPPTTPAPPAAPRNTRDDAAPKPHAADRSDSDAHPARAPRAEASEGPSRRTPERALEPPPVEAQPAPAPSATEPPASVHVPVPTDSKPKPRRRRVRGVSKPGAPARQRLSLEGGLGTTVSLDGLAVPTITGRAGVEYARNRLRLGLRGHAESARDIDPGGAVSVRHAQIELAAGPAFAEGNVLHGAVLVGAGVDLIAARADGHARADVQRSFTPIGSLALRAALRAHAALDVFASAELVVALRRERFIADGAPLAQTARSRMRLLVGVSWHVF